MRLERIADRYIPTDLGLYYDEVAGVDPQFTTNLYRFPSQERRLDRMIEWCLALVGEHGVRTCLEMGCAEGHVTTQLSKVFDEIWAIDISETLISRCPDLYNATFVCADVTHFYACKDQYDVIVMSEILEHLRDPRELLEEWAPETRFLLVTCPVTEGKNVKTFDSSLLGKESVPGDASGHIWSMDFLGFKSLFAGLPCDIIKSTWLDHSGMALLKRREP